MSFTHEFLTVCENVTRVERENGLLSPYIWKIEWLCQKRNSRRSCKRKFRFQEHEIRCLKCGSEKRLSDLLSSKGDFTSK